MLEGHKLYALKKQEEHQKRIADITREFMESEYLKDFYTETLTEQNKDLFGDGRTLGGIGEGHYYTTVRKCIEDALYQLFEQDWKLIREHKKIYEYLVDTVSQKLQDEAEYMDNIEDYISPRDGNLVCVSVDIDDIFKTMLKEIEQAITDEMIRLLITEVKQE